MRSNQNAQTAFCIVTGFTTEELKEFVSLEKSWEEAHRAGGSAHGDRKADGVLPRATEA